MAYAWSILQDLPTFADYGTPLGGGIARVELGMQHVNDDPINMTNDERFLCAGGTLTASSGKRLLL
jgi:hypothetical protein